MTESIPILTAAEEEAESQARLLALRRDYDNILCGGDEEDDGPEVVLGVMPVWPKGSRGARIMTGHMHAFEFAEFHRHQEFLKDSVLEAALCTSEYSKRAARGKVAEGQENYVAWMNQADWQDGYGIPLYRADFNPATGTYPDKMAR